MFLVILRPSTYYCIYVESDVKTKHTQAFPFNYCFLSLLLVLRIFAIRMYIVIRKTEAVDNIYIYMIKKKINKTKLVHNFGWARINGDLYIS